MKDSAEKSPRQIFSVRRPPFASIRERLFLLILLVVIPVMLVQIAFIYVRYRARVESASRADLELSRAVAATFKGFVKDIVDNELSIGESFTMAAPPSAAQMNRLLELNKEGFPAVYCLIWMGPHGRVVASSHGSAVGLDLSDRNYVHKLMSGKEWMVGDVIRSRATGKLIFTVSRAIRGEKGNLLGIVAAAIQPDMLGDIISMHLPQDEAITIIDSHGEPVYQEPQGEWNRWGQRFFKVRPAIMEVLEGKRASLVFPRWETGENRLVAVVPISSIGWAASVGRSRNRVMAPIRSQLIQEIVIFFLIMVGVFLGAFTLSEGLSSSIRRLLEHAVALGGGHLKGAIEERGPSELKGLASAFNVMAEKVGAREKALMAAQERLISVFEAIPACVYLQSPDGSIRFANRWFRETFGDPAGKRCYDLLRSKCEPCGDCNVLCAVDTQTPRQWEWTCPRGKCYSIHTHPFTDSDGAPLALKLIVDISERKRAWQAFLESEKRYRELVQNANSAIIRFKSDGTVTFFNEYAQTFFGYREEEVIGRPVDILLPEKQSDGADLSMLFRDVVSDPERYLEHVNENIRRDGSRVWMAWTNKPILDESGKVTGILSVGIDITALKRAEETQRKSEERFRELAENIRDVFWVITPDELLYVSPAYEEIWGRSCESLYDNPASFMELLHPEDRERVKLALTNFFEVKGPLSGEFRIIRGDGTMRWIFVRSFPIFEQGRLVRTVGIAEDVTAVKQAEEFLRVERDLAFGLGAADSLVEGMKHLLKACLNFNGLDSGAICLIESGTLKVICHQGLSDVFLESAPFMEKLSSHARFAMKGAAHWSKPFDIPGMDDLLEKEGILAFLVIPVIYRGEVVSLLYIASHAEHEIPENIKTAVEVFATHIEGIISRIRLLDTVKAQSEGLQESSAALKVLLQQREEDRKELEASLLKNVRHLVSPYMEKLKKSRLADEQKDLVEILESHLQEITSPFAHKISAPLLGLTPTEIRVADLIRQGKGSKEIADLLGISEYAVIFHRQGIRRKLGLTGKKLNLQKHLGMLQ